MHLLDKGRQGEGVAVMHTTASSHCSTSRKLARESLRQAVPLPVPAPPLVPGTATITNAPEVTTQGREISVEFATSEVVEGWICLQLSTLTITRVARDVRTSRLDVGALVGV